MNNQICKTNEFINFENEIGLYPAIGFSNITNQEVDDAIKSLMSIIERDYFQLINESKNKDWGSRTFKVYPEKNQNSENPDIKAPYYFRQKIAVNTLENKDSFDFLLQKLHKSIFDLGYKNESDTGFFDIRFEKGYSTPLIGYNSDKPQWHFDRGLFKTSITVCWSNRDNWCTKIININQPPEELEEFKEGMKRDNSYCAKYLKYAEFAKFGFLYDAMNLCHLAPEENGVQPEEHRLFIRYNEFWG